LALRLFSASLRNAGALLSGIGIQLAKMIAVDGRHSLKRLKMSALALRPTAALDLRTLFPGRFSPVDPWDRSDQEIAEHRAVGFAAAFPNAYEPTGGKTVYSINSMH
jgi:hypothetical protein